MATENPVRLIGSSGDRNWPTSIDAASYASSSSSHEVTAQELGLLLQGHGFNGNRDFTGPNRSGSAPPSIEGSSLAIGDLRRHQNSSLEGIFESLTNAVDASLSEEQLRSDPAYLAYYYSNVNLNPRLPPPLVSRENRRLAHHIGAFGENWRVSSFDDTSKGSSSLMSRPVLSTHKEEPEDDRSPGSESEGKAETNTTAFLSGQYASRLQGRHKSLVDLIQEDFPRTPSPVYNNKSHQSSHGSKEPAASNTCGNPLVDSSISITKEETKTATAGVRAHTSVPSSRTADPSVHPIDSNPKNDVSTSLNPKTLSSSPQAEQNALNTASENSVLPNSVAGSNVSSIKNEMRNLRISDDGSLSQLVGQHLQQSSVQHRGSSFQAQIGQAQVNSQVTPRPNNPADHLSHRQPKQPLSDVQQPAMISTGITPTVYGTGAAFGTPYGPNLQPSGMYPPQFSLGGYALNASLVPPFVTGYYPFTTVPMPLDNNTNLQFGNRAVGASAGGGALADLQSFYKFYDQFGLGTQPFPDPAYMHYFQHDAYTGLGQYDPTGSRGSTVGIPSANYDLQMGQSSAAQSHDQRPPPLRTGPVNIQNVRKGGVGSPTYSGSPHSVTFMMQYPTSPLPSPVYQGSPSAGRRNDSLRSPYNSGRAGGAFSGWQGNRGRERVDDQRPLSFLEELKSSKSRRYELSDIAGRIVEFSADQHGSRFIQQKLETCTAEEKASVFQEVLPHASRLMTDVFGNYVIQKFFEHGNPDQRKELANRLVGHVLPLSLQMYGCRVIQKALEVIEIDQKTQLVHELDGHVMRCVRDQNGNHVIQKCIECVPTEKIAFIISAFRTNVASLSMHPYGCRVIQRVLEHCTDEMQVQCIVDEILQSACILAQDQYGNYVTQHVLERGRPLERSQVVSKLAGQVVQMSQHKFASNVIEKCLEYGSSEERDVLIEEIVGQTEGNDNLLVMMKDQFANYVVQRILDTCNDKQREILLNRIKDHLQALKKYTYGKHIVARFEQFCGEESEVSE